MLLSEHYENSKYSENGKNYFILEFGKNQRSKFKLQCIICNDVNTVTAASVLSGKKPCLCSAKAHNSPSKMFSRLLTVCEDKQIKIDIQYILNAKEKFTTQCLVCGLEWKSSYNLLCLKNAGCPKCKNCLKWDKEDFRIKLQDLLQIKACELIFIEHTPLAHHSRVGIRCTVCDHLWETVAASTLQGSGCPICVKYGFQKSKPACLYLIELKDFSGKVLGYKYGITCDLRRRIFQHIRSNKSVDIKFELINQWYYSDGFTAFSHESELKKVFLSYYSKDSLPAGHTETISPLEYNSLMEIQNKQYKEYINGN